ncbi:MAG: DUF2461 domain-containing protein [Rhodobiaceae bacterium]|nr:DUF2461 domain-containing protein [Rhodobiaceae bacterium]
MAKVPSENNTGSQGFGETFFSFFRELADNNSKEWFEANRTRYKQDVQAPLSAFVEAMAPHIHAISPHFNADPRPNGKTIFRIHRDVRFSRDKRPYKEHAACHFRHAGENDAWAGLLRPSCAQPCRAGSGDMDAGALIAGNDTKED